MLCKEVSLAPTLLRAAEAGRGGHGWQMPPHLLQGSSSHSLRYLMAMWGPDHGLHQLFALGYLDDQLLMRYDSNTRTTLPRVPWMRKVEEKDPDYWKWQSWGAEHLRKKFTEDVAKLQKHTNQTGAFYTFQRIVLCELSADGQKGTLMRYGYDGRDLLRLDLETLTWTAAADALPQVLKGGWDADLASSQRSKAFLEGRCFELLQQFRGYGEESLLRTELPVVNVTRKTSSNGSLDSYVCRAHGFYPKEVAIGWRKDGKVWEGDTVHGGVTPNSDGTYHTWLSIRTDPKDRGRYQCRVEHAGLQEPLEVAWKEPASAWPLVGSISGAAALLLVAGTLLLLRKRMKQRGASTAAANQSGPQGFTSLPKSDDGFSLLSFPASDPAVQATKDPPPS